MAVPKTRLEKVKLSEVSVVPRGANAGAEVVLFKGEEAMTEEELAKAAAAAAADPVEDPDADPEPDTALTFKAVLAEEKAEQDARRALDPLWDFTSALRQSLDSILEDKSVTDKSAMAQASLDQFTTAVVSLFKGEPVEKIAAALVEPEAGDSGQSPLSITKGATSMADPVVAKADEAPVVTITKADYDVLKAQADAATAAQVASAATIAKMLDDQSTQVCIAKASTLTALPVEPDKFAAVLKSVPAEHQDELMRVLSAANALVAKAAALTGEVGTAITKASGEESPLIKKIKADAEAAKGKC